MRPTRRLGLEIGTKLIVVSLVTLSGSGRFVAGKDHRRGASQTAPQSTAVVTVRVYNYAHVPGQLLDRAETEASTIFLRTGIEVEWVDCPLTAEQMALYPACQGSLEAADVVLNLLPESMAQRAALRDTTFGFARLSSDGRGSYLASVFWDRIVDAKRAGDLSAYQLLGHVMAHEIGHLLLGSMSHAWTGLMGANWGPPELETMARGYLLFTPGQCRQIRAESLARMRQEELGARRIELAERVH